MADLVLRFFTAALLSMIVLLGGGVGQAARIGEKPVPLTEGTKTSPETIIRV